LSKDQKVQQHALKKASKLWISKVHKNIDDSATRDIESERAHAAQQL